MDEIAILRAQAAKLNDAAMIASTRGRPDLANDLRWFARQLSLTADEKARPHQWTGSHPGDLAGP